MAAVEQYFIFDSKLCKAEGLTKEQIYNLIAEATGVTPQDADEGFISTIVETNHSASLHLWKGTAAEYQALETHDPNTFYIIDDDTTISDLRALINELSGDVEDFGDTIDSFNQQLGELTSQVEDQAEELENIGKEIEITNSQYAAIDKAGLYACECANGIVGSYTKIISEMLSISDLTKETDSGTMTSQGNFYYDPTTERIVSRASMSDHYPFMACHLIREYDSTGFRITFNVTHGHYTGDTRTLTDQAQGMISADAGYRCPYAITTPNADNVYDWQTGSVYLYNITGDVTVNVVCEPE